MDDASVFSDLEVIRLTKEGVFLSDGEEITHTRTVLAFHRFLGRDSEGYFIRIGRDFKRIEVEDTAYFVTDLEWISTPSGNHVILKLNDETQETLRPDTLAYSPNRLVCQVKEGKEKAKFIRRAYLELLMKALTDEGGYTLEFEGVKIRIENDSI